MYPKSIRTIGVLTSGGDAPGMNPCIRAVVRAGLAHGLRVVAVEGGYQGLIHGTFREMGARDVGGILQRGGTIIQTARSLEFKEPRGQREAIRQMSNYGLDALVILGGDGSLNGAVKLADQGQLPLTMTSTEPICASGSIPRSIPSWTASTKSETQPRRTAAPSWWKPWDACPVI
jgi:6-phosphofructokinase